jgi:hypothetical protein
MLQGIGNSPNFTPTISVFIYLRYADEIICDHHDEFLHLSDASEKKLEYDGTGHHILVDLKKGYDSFGGEVLYNSLSEFNIFMGLFRLIKVCLNDAHSKVLIEICLIWFLFRMV